MKESIVTFHGEIHRLAPDGPWPVFKVVKVEGTEGTIHLKVNDELILILDQQGA